MRVPSLLLAALILTATAVHLVRADVASPGFGGRQTRKSRLYHYRPVNITPLRIEGSDTITQPLLQIPRSFLHRATQVACTEQGPPHLGASLERGGRKVHLAAVPLGLLGLFAALGCRSIRRGRWLALVLVLGILAMEVGILRAGKAPNAAVPSSIPNLGLGEIRIEVTGEGKEAHLLVPRELLRQIRDQVFRKPAQDG